MQLTPEETKQLREEYEQEMIKSKSWSGGLFGSFDEIGDETEFTVDEDAILEFFISRINTLLEEKEKGLVEKIEEEKFIVTESSGEYTGWIHNRSMNKGMEKAINIIKNQ